jgi:AcrR family transcriptional regulator
VPTPRARLTREAIVAATRAVIEAEGRDAVSLRRIAARLGVTAPALYAHYENKESLLAAVADDTFGRLIASLEASTEGVRDPLERIKAQSRAYVRFAIENPALFQVIFLFRPPWSYGAATAELPLVTKAFELSAAPVQEAIEAGRLRERDPLKASLTLFSAVHGVATLLVARPQLGERFESELVEAVLDSIVNGLATTPPRGPKKKP